MATQRPRTSFATAKGSLESIRRLVGSQNPTRNREAWWRPQIHRLVEICVNKRVDDISLEDLKTEFSNNRQEDSKRSHRLEVVLWPLLGFFMAISMACRSP
jgi:hypothetical protein